MKKMLILIVILPVAVVLLLVANTMRTSRRAPGNATAGDGRESGRSGSSIEECEQDAEPKETPEERIRRQDRLIEQSKRYHEIMAEYRGKFKPPGPGDKITVKLRNGTTIEGVLEEYDDSCNPKGVMTIHTTSGVVDLRRNTISEESVLQYYTLDHLVYWTQQKMAEEFPDYQPPTNVFVIGGGYPLPIYPVSRTNKEAVQPPHSGSKGGMGDSSPRSE